MQALAAPEMEMLAKYAPYAPVQQSNNMELIPILIYTLGSICLLSAFLIKKKGNFNSNNMSIISSWLCVTFIIALIMYSMNPAIAIEAPEVIIAFGCSVLVSCCISSGFAFWW